LWYALLWAQFIFVSTTPVPGAAADLHRYAIVRDDATLKIEGRIIRLFGIYTAQICDAFYPSFLCAQQEAEVRRANAERAYQERFLGNRISQQYKDQQVKRNEIAFLELEIEHAEKMKKLQALQGEAEQPKTRKRRTQLHDQLLKEYEKIDKEYLKKKKKIEESDLSPEAQKLSFRNIESWREQMKEAVERQFERALKEEHNE
jgi:hypothetical protein